jgi:hypothetical protein
VSQFGSSALHEQVGPRAKTIKCPRIGAISCTVDPWEGVHRSKLIDLQSSKVLCILRGFKQ